MTKQIDRRGWVALVAFVGIVTLFAVGIVIGSLIVLLG